MPSRLLRSLIGAALAVAVLVPAMSMGPVEPAGALTPKVLATLPVDQYAYVGAVNPVTNRLYETNGVTGELSTLDGGTLATLDTLVIGRHAGVAGVDAVRNLVCVVSYPDTGVEIDVVDGSTGAVTASIPLGADYVHDVAINPTTGKLYVLTSTLTQVDFVRDWAIAVIDESTFQVTASIPLPSMAMRIAVNPVTGKLYVLVSNSKSIMVIDGTSNEVITTLTVGPDPYDVCVNDVTNMIYVSTWFEYDPPSIPPDSIEEIPPGAIWPIDGATDHVESHIRVGRSPMSIACNTATNQVFFANESGSEVAVLDGVSRSIVGSFGEPGTTSFYGLRINPVTNRAYAMTSSPSRALLMIDASFVRPVLVPSAPTIDSVTREDGGLTIRWTDGGEELTARTVRVYAGSTLVVTDTSCTVSPCTIQDLHNGTAYTVTMTDTNAKGTGPPSAPSPPVTPAATPVAPTVSSQPTQGAATISWAPADGQGSPITDYLLETSSDAFTWSRTDLHSTATSAQVALPVASARWVRVAGVNDVGVGSFCDPVVAASSGTAPQDVSVVTGQGPVTGGAVSWEMQPRTAWSSKSYGLLSDGSIRFPAAPAGRVAVTIADGVLPDGTLISGKLYGVLGIGTLVLHPPPEPAASASTIHVETPSGAPLPGATVSLTGVSATRSSEGMAFTAPNAARSGVTDLNGDFRAYGFASPDAEATVSFDDGVITQQQVVALTPPTTTVTMPYNPEVQPTVTSVEARSGEAVVETLRVTGPSNQRPSARGASSPTRAGIVVRANLPKGTPVGTCGAVLSAVTNAKGKAKLRICATTSTTIGFSATGAYVVGALRLFVKGAAPTAVIDLHASTPSTGCLKVGWLPPEYTGGHPVTSYSVYVTAQGQPTVSLTTTRTSVKVKGLANATRYRVWVAARTSKGAGPGASITAPVA